MFSQEVFCDFFPEQGFPFPDGLGLVQARDLDFVPEPQVLEHSVQALQLDHPPSTPECDPDPDFEVIIIRIYMHFVKNFLSLHSIKSIALKGYLKQHRYDIGLLQLIHHSHF